MSVTERRRVSARRESLLGDEPGAFASARFVRVTPMKARRVVDMVRGMQVDEALALLQFAPQAAAETVYKVLESAVANAETTEDLDRGSLVDEEWLLKLERKHFVELAQQEKTQARIGHMLKTGKPLRN